MHAFITSTQWNWLIVEKNAAVGKWTHKILPRSPPTHMHKQTKKGNLSIAFKSCIWILLRLWWHPVVPACLFLCIFTTLCHHYYRYSRTGCMHWLHPSAFCTFKSMFAHKTELWRLTEWECELFNKAHERARQDTENTGLMASLKCQRMCGSLVCVCAGINR